VQIDFSKVPSLIARWWFLLVAGAIVGGVAGYLAVRTMQPVFQASVTVQVTRSPDAQSDDPIRVQTLIKTYAELVRTLPILSQAAARAGIAVTPSELQAGVTTTPIRETQLLRITVEDTDRERVVSFAAELVNALSAQIDEDQVSRFTASKSAVNQAIESLRTAIGNREARAALIRAEPESSARDASLALAESELLEARNNYSGALKSQADLLLLEARSRDRLTVVEPPRQPDSPVRPSRSRVILIGIFGGLTVALAIIGAFVYLEHWWTRPRASNKFGSIPVLAEVSLRDAIGTRVAIGRISDAFDSLPELIASQGIAVRSILVTSASPMEGKSSVAASIAVSLARSGRRVVLVDGDLRQPTQASLFALQDGAGLSTLLFTTGKPVMSVLRETAIRGLRILTAGPLPPDPASFLREHSTRERLSELYDISDVVVVDGPPISAGPDTFLIGMDTDATLLVVDGRTGTAEEVGAASAALEACGIRAVGTVVHGVDMADRASTVGRPSVSQKQVRGSGHLTLTPSGGEKWS
jgi:polysaccharide biosynthesis transport protein